MKYSEIRACDTRAAARRVIDRAVAEMIRPADAVDLVGARFVREITGTPWGEDVPATLRAKWRQRIAEHVMGRWTASRIEMMTEDALGEAAKALEIAAKKAGIELSRSPRNTLEDAASRTAWRASR